MKIMMLLKNKFLLILFSIILNVSSIQAHIQWDVVAIFLGKNEDQNFQKDINENIAELKKVNSPSVNISILVETDKTTNKSLNQYIQKSFARKNSKKLLIIYSHGEGVEGLKNYPTETLKKEVLKDIPKLDLLWLDACFMANIEFLHQVKGLSDYTLASEDAEFSSGMPFESLNEISKYNTTEEAAKFLAQSFLHSYSYTLKGSQRLNVHESSATISLIENSKLDFFVKKLAVSKKVFSQLAVNEQKQMTNFLSKSYTMDKKELVDLGHLLIQLRSKNKNQDLDNQLTELIRMLNISSIKSLKSNPRVKIMNPTSESIVVFGYNNWRAGSKNDYTAKDSIFMKGIKPDGYIQGPNGDEWPYFKLISKSKIVHPFIPSIDEFNYYILDTNIKMILQKNVSIKRSIDLFEKVTEEPSKLIKYFGYTQKVGKNAEKYSGINITNLDSVPSFDYFESEFNQLTKWLSL